MIVTVKNIKKMTFPVFELPSSDWYLTDGVLFLDGKVIDEKNMPGKTLGIRRIQSGRLDLLKLRKVITDFSALIRSKKKAFIDTKGKPFIYEKTVNCKIKCYKIDRIQKKDFASLLWLHNVPHPFTIERPPLPQFEWARMIEYNNDPWMVYNYVRVPTKDTYRRV